MPIEYDPKLDDGQQLVVAEEPSQQPGQERPQVAPGGEAQQYMEDLENFAANCTKLDDFYQYARIFNVRMRNVPGSENLRGIMEQFAQEVGTMANDANLATVTQSNQSYVNSQVDTTEQLAQAREKFRKILPEMGPVMSANWNDRGVQRTVDVTQVYLDRYATTQRGPRQKEDRQKDVYAAPGAGQAERQEALNSIYNYMTAVTEQAGNEYVSVVSGAKDKEDFYQRSYARIVANISKGQGRNRAEDIEFGRSVPSYDPQKHGPYGSREGIQKYCQELDSFFSGMVAGGKTEAVKKTAGRMKAGTDYVTRANNMNSLLKDVNELLNDPAYPDDVKKSYMQQMSDRMNMRGAAYIRVTKDMTPQAWMKELTEQAQETLKDPHSSAILQGELNGICKEGKEQMAQITKASGLRNTFETLRDTTNRSFSNEFDSVLTSMNRLYGSMDSGSPVTEGQLNSVEACCLDYCMRKVRQNKSSYDSMEATRLGGVIETLKTLNPERGKMMEEVFGMTVTKTGDQKSYSFQKIPQSLLKTTGGQGMSLTQLEENIASYREKQASMGDAPQMGRLAGISNSIIKNVKDADPALMRSSSEYRAFRRESQALADAMTNLEKVQREGGEITAEQKQQILERTKAVREAANTYREYKQNQKMSDIAKRRFTVAGQSITAVEALEDSLRASFAKQEFAADPKAAIKGEIDFVSQNRSATPDNLAKMIFLKSAEKAISNGSDPKVFAEVLANPDKLKERVTEIQSSDAFKAATAQFADKKNMADVQPDKLFNGYLTEVNKVKQQEMKQPQPQPQPTVQKQTDQLQVSGPVA